jgi:hypothetical protein
MAIARRLGILVFLLLLSLTVPPFSSAQALLDPGQLPGRTTFYLLWRGAPAGEIRKNNFLYALWDDPEFSAARASFIDSFLNNAETPKGKPALSREEFAQYVTLLDNAFLVGYLRSPHSPATAKSPAEKPAHSWNGIFLIYDRTGKEELLSKAVSHMRGADTDIPKLTPLTVAGVSALKVERKSSTTYWAEFGKYAVSAGEAPVFEEIVNRLNGKPASGSLSQSAAYQEAKPHLSGGAVEFFLGIPPVKDLELDSASNPVVPLKPILTALKLESIHSVAGHVSLEGAKTHADVALLGDTAPGGLFDIWADGQANPASLVYLSADTVYYSESQFNLPGIYETVKRAVGQASGNSAQGIGMLESAAETRLGMPLPDALKLTTGEFASLQTSPTFDDSQKIFVLGIRSKPDTLKLARTILGDRISSERKEGSATFLKVSLGGGQSSAGVMQWNFYYLAMTPTMLFGSSKSDTIRKYIAQSSNGADPSLPKNLLSARGHFPEKLNGFSYFDFQRVDWSGLKAKWAADVNKAAHDAKSTDEQKKQRQLADWLNQVNPEVFPRHLHTMTGASWKDAKGVHIEQWLD